MLRLLASLLLVLLPLLAHCAPQDALEKAEDSLRVYNWNDYIAPQVLER
jgi:putrescine transport system substrate-binding protein